MENERNASEIESGSLMSPGAALVTCLKRIAHHHRSPATLQSLTAGLPTTLDEFTPDLLTRAAEYKDPETGAHINRIGAYAALLAAELGWSREQCEMIRLAAPLHDVGKVATPDAVLLKKSPLTDEEFATMRQHPKFGYEVLSVSDYPVMAMAARIALNHHERWDGGGYPRGLTGSEIPLEASITTLVDVYDALRSVRPYKPSMTHEEAMTVILEGDGRTSPSHFRPEVLEAFKGADQAMNHIFESMAD